MQRGATEATRATEVADIQFAGKRKRRIDWRSRPAAELDRSRLGSSAAVTERLEKGLLLDGLR
jgi:hypothetical protein